MATNDFLNLHPFHPSLPLPSHCQILLVRAFFPLSFFLFFKPRPRRGAILFLSGNYLFNRGGEVQPRFYFSPFFFFPSTNVVYTRATWREGGERERKVEWCKYFSRSPVRWTVFYARCMRKLRGIRSRCKNTAEKRGETYSRRGAQHRFNIDRNAPPRIPPCVFMIFSRACTQLFRE